MVVNYDFHIHSALSPCADNEMSPLNILLMAEAKGLNAVAITDHNSIKNVPAALEIGEALGIAVIPGIEVQTAEDIHVVALFETYSELQHFYNQLQFPPIKNRVDIFGEQLVFNADNEVVDKEEMLLHCSAYSGLYEIVPLILSCGGKAIAAHIDRSANGILSILGAVPEDVPFSALEFSPHAPDLLKDRYRSYHRLINSDAHTLEQISNAGNTLICASLSPAAILSAI